MQKERRLTRRCKFCNSSMLFNEPRNMPGSDKPVMYIECPACKREYPDERNNEIKP